CTFALQNFPRQPQALPELDARAIPVECMHSRYELMLLLTETPEGIAGNMVYNTRLFEHTTVGRMMEHLVRIAEAMCTAPDAPLSSLSFATPAELYQALRLDPAEYERILPLNPMQRDIYMDALAHPDSPQNTVGGALDIHTEVDPVAWQAALERLTAQQPVLRTRIHTSSVPWTEPAYQAILRRDTPRLEVDDWSTRDLQGESLQQALDDLIRRPFPTDGPLVRHVLLRLAPARWLAVLINHHLLLDGIATANALRWLADSHDGREPIALSPGAFHAGLAQRRASSDTTELLAWWQERLANVAPPHCPGAARHGQAMQRQQRRLPVAPDLWEGIKRFSRRQGITPQIFMKAVFALAADAHGECAGDLLIQEFTAGRPPGEGEALGCYYQALPFVAPRALLAGGSFAGLMAHTRDWQKDAVRRSGLSILELRRLAPPGRTTFMFNYITAQLEVMVGGRPTEMRRFTPHADGFVQFEISFSGDGVLMSLSYDPAHFAEAGFLERVQSLCRQLLATAPEQPLGELSWLLQGEGWHTAHPHAGPAGFIPLVTRIADQAKRTPEAPAVIQGQRHLSYAQLQDAASVLARRLQAAGAGPGERVGICLPRSPDMLVALLAVLQSGAAYVPMDAGYPPERLQRIAGDAGCRLILTHASLRPRLLQSGSALLALDEDSEPPCEALPALPQRQFSDPFYVLYTSGSTGRPKGAVVGDGAFANLVDWYGRECSLGPADRVLILSAFGFDLTQKNLFAALCAGAAVVLPQTEGFDPEHLCANIAAQRATLVNCAPSAFVALLDAPGHTTALASLRLVVLGGEPIPLARLAPWLGHTDCRAQIINSYGPTECTDVVAWH
ncbi:MAG TPA: AMP-binding protein, partial [Solimonas sp.]